MPTGPIALPAAVPLSLFIPRQHIARRCPLWVLRLVLVCWCGTIRIVAVPLMVIGTIGTCLAIAVRAIFILIIAIPIIGVIVVACVVPVRRGVSRITGLRRVRVRIIRGHRRIVGSTAIHRTLIILVVRAPVALFSRSDGTCILYALLCCQRSSVVVVQRNLRERRLRSVMDDTILVCPVREVAGRLFLSELLNSCHSLLSLPLDQLGDTLVDLVAAIFFEVALNVAQ